MDIGDVKIPEGARATLSKFYDRLTRNFGVTMRGNRLTLRSDDAEIHCVILEVSTPAELAEHVERSHRFRKIMDKYDKLGHDVEADLYWVENNELPK